MNLHDMLARTGGLDSIARELGVSHADVANGTQALLPAILGGLQRQAQGHPSGADALGGLLGRMGGGGLLDDVLSPEPTQVDRGNNVLGEIFGSKQVSRDVAQRASQRSGLNPQLLKKMLPMLAMLVTGYLSRHQGNAGMQSGGGLPGGLGNVIGGMLGGSQQGSMSSIDWGGLAAMLDKDGDGNPFDDILGMIKKSRT